VQIIDHKTHIQDLEMVDLDVINGKGIVVYPKIGPI
jgi:hypothetical protein